MVHCGPFWPEEVHHFGPFRSANRTLAIPERRKLVTKVHADLVFSGVHLVFEVFQDAWCSNKGKTQCILECYPDCPFKASNNAN